MSILVSGLVVEHNHRLCVMLGRDELRLLGVVPASHAECLVHFACCVALLDFSMLVLDCLGRRNIFPAGLRSSMQLMEAKERNFESLW